MKSYNNVNEIEEKTASTGQSKPQRSIKNKISKPKKTAKAVKRM